MPCITDQSLQGKANWLNFVTEEAGEVFFADHFKNWQELFSILTGSVVDSNIDKRYHCQMHNHHHCLFCSEIDLTLCQPQSRLNKVIHGSSWIMLSWQSSSQVEMFFKERSTLCILRREKQSVIFANQGLVQAVDKLALTVNKGVKLAKLPVPSLHLVHSANHSWGTGTTHLFCNMTVMTFNGDQFSVFCPYRI